MLLPTLFDAVTVAATVEASRFDYICGRYSQKFISLSTTVSIILRNTILLLKEYIVKRSMTRSCYQWTAFPFQSHMMMMISIDFSYCRCMFFHHLKISACKWRRANVLLTPVHHLWSNIALHTRVTQCPFLTTTTGTINNTFYTSTYVWIQIYNRPRGRFLREMCAIFLMSFPKIWDFDCMWDDVTNGYQNQIFSYFVTLLHMINQHECNA